MVWLWQRSRGGGTLLLLVLSLLCSAAADVAVTFSSTPRRVSSSASARFAFRVAGCTTADCAVTCQLDGEAASECGGRGSSSAAAGRTVSVGFAGLKDGKHTLAVCAAAADSRSSSSGTSCATYAWDVDTVPPTASVWADSAAFTSASTVAAFISFSEPCPGFVCNATTCHLLVYGPGRVQPSSLRVLRRDLLYSVAVAISPRAQYGRLILVTARAPCADAAGHRFARSPNSSFTLRFDSRSNSMAISGGVPERLLRIRGVPRLVQATNDERDLRVYVSFAQPVLNSSAEVLSVLRLRPSDAAAVLTVTPTTNRSTLGNRRFGYAVTASSSSSSSTTSSAIVVTVSCDADAARSIISRQGTPVKLSPAAFTFLYDTQRSSVKLGLGTSTWRRTISSRSIPVLIKFAKPVFNFTASAVQLAGGNVLSFHEEEGSKSMYALQVEAVDSLVSLQVAENAAQDAAGNPNLASDRLQLTHYSVPASSSSIARTTTAVFVATAVVTTLLSVSTSSLLASGAIIDVAPTAIISDPSRNLLRMACHLQMLALSRWVSVNLPIDYYEFANGIQWTIPYMRLPWEWEDPFVMSLGYGYGYGYGYSTTTIASDGTRWSAAVAATATTATGTGTGTTMMPIFPTGDDDGRRRRRPPAAATGDENAMLAGTPLTAVEYRSLLLENYENNKPEAQMITKQLQDDPKRRFGRNMLWLGVMGGGMLLLHLLTLLYLRLRFVRYGGGTGRAGGTALPMMVVILAVPCVSQAAAAAGLRRAVGIALAAVLACLLLGLLLFLSLGIAMGRLLQYSEEGSAPSASQHWCEGVVRRALGPGRRGQWTWKRQPQRPATTMLGPLFEDLRGQWGVYWALLEWVKRVGVGFVAGAHATAPAALVLVAIAASQLLFLLLMKPFIRRRVQLLETLSVATELLVFAMASSSSSSRSLSLVLGPSMLGAFLLGFAAQTCNQWHALYRQVRLLSADGTSSSSSFLGGAKAASKGLLLLLLPLPLTPAPAGGGGGGDDHRSSSKKERRWPGQLREMAKASFGESSSSGAGARGGNGGNNRDSSKSRGRLCNDLEAIFSDTDTNR